MKRIFMLIALALPLALASCDKAGDSNNNQNKPKDASFILGTWSADKVSLDIVTENPVVNEFLKIAILESNGLDDTPSMTFLENGIVVFTQKDKEGEEGEEDEEGENNKGSYSLKDGILKMEQPDGKNISMTASMPDQNTLILTYNMLPMFDAETLEEMVKVCGNISKCDCIITYKKVG